MYENCFGKLNGRCVVLNEMLCKSGNCPFYKSKKQYEEEQIKYPHRDEKKKKFIERMADYE